MSRTDKDAPNWVRSEYYIAWHSLYCPYGMNMKSRAHSCNLPPEPIRRRDGRSWIRGCSWEPEWDRRTYYHSPSREDRHVNYWGPDRALVRDFCHQAVKDPDDPDLIEPVRQHRHSSYKGWWW